MNSSDCAPDEGRRYTRRLVVLVLVLAAGFIGWSSWNSYQEFVRGERALARQSTEGTARIVGLFLDEARQIVSLVAQREAGALAAYSQDPNNEQLTEHFREILDGHLTGHFAFSIADREGNVILDDLEGKVGDVCQADIRQFAAGEHPTDIYIHPNPLGYHFDVMARFRGPDDVSGILFVSFKPSVLAQILASSELPRHRLLLMNAQDESLIEVTSEGSRQQIQREIRLSDGERDRILGRSTVPDSRWVLIDLPESGLFAERQMVLWRQAVFIFVLFLATTLFMLWLIKGAEERRERAERALHESHRRLESRVRERTRELSDANARLEGQIAERERFEKALRDSEQRYALAVTGANDGIWDWKLPSDIHFSPRWKSMLGFNDDELSNDVNTWLGRIHPEDRRLMNSAIARIQSSQDDQLELEYRMRHRDGSWRWFRCRGAAVRDEQGMVIRIAGSQSDIHARKRAEAQLIHDAFHDAMTGLPNRALFLDRLDRAVQIAFRDNKLLAVLFLDLDRFKLINDSLGHALGDQLLVEVSKRVEACVRPGDTLARLGGDEFTVLLESIEDETMAEQTARRIQQALEQPFDVDGHTIYTSASVGIAFSNESEQEPGGLLRDADIAMYRAKAKGKARYEVFEKEVRTAILEGLYLETDLRQALDRQQLTLFYQPIVSVSTGRLRGFEALIRWLHPERGLVLPDEFIPTAEETGLIQSIGTWVMETACGQMQAWRQIGPDSGAVELSVNLSSRQFLQDDLLEVFSGIFSRLGVGESNLSLDLEITESVLMENAERSKEVLNRLKRLGVRLSVDDFGTGYSSLSYLHRFPVDSLKIDRSFVSRIDSDRESREIVQAIIALAHNLGLTVIAEGVERQAHFEVLQKMNCDFAQGFYFARPLPVDDAQALLASQPQWGKWTEDGRASS